MAKVLFDHNVPPCIARALHEIISIEGHEAVALRDRFSPKITDIDLYRALGAERGWIVISRDAKQARRPAERAAVLQARLLVFYLKPAVEKMRMAEQAAVILWHWDKIVQQRQIVESGLFLLPENKSSLLRAL